MDLEVSPFHPASQWLGQGSPGPMNLCFMSVSTQCVDPEWYRTCCDLTTDSFALAFATSCMYRRFRYCSERTVSDIMGP